MRIRTFKGLVQCASLIVCSCAAVYAQTSSPSPSPTATPGPYNVTSSIEFGARALSVNGDHDKYRSDLNYRPGFRVFDSSFLIENNSTGSRLFDSAFLSATGFGADPSGAFRANLDRTGLYKFDANVRRVRYFNNLKNHVSTFSQPVSLGSQHRFNTVRNFGDIDLTIFPARDFRLRFGYSFNDQEGPGTNTLRFSGDEYQVNSAIKNRAHDIRAGAEGSLLGFNVGATYGHRTFRDNTRFFVDALNIGNNPATTTSFINQSTRDFDVDGKTDFVNAFVQRTFARKFDMASRFIYSNSISDMTETDLLTGRASSTGNFILSDEISIPGRAKRTQSRGDIGFTYRANDHLRISNTFTFDQFNVGGSHTLSELVRATTGAGVPIANAVTNSSAWRGTSYRRFSNQTELDYQVNNLFAFNFGFRVGQRRINVALYDVNLVTNAVQRSGQEELHNRTVTVMGGARIKPTPNWRIYIDAESGESDNVFTRLANDDFTNFRIRSMADVGDVTLNVSFVLKNNETPGTSVAITGTTGLPSVVTVAESRSRIFSASLDWSARSNFGISAGYTYSHHTSNTDIIVPVGTPIFPSTRFLFGVSQYYMRDNYFFFDVNAQPHKRVTLFASYRIDNDRGQGDRLQLRPQDILSSYPMRFQTPEARVAIRLTRNIDWNLGYQYYSYRETPGLNTFATPLVVFPAQNYNAHLPYTSLRIFFGGRAGDR